MAKHNYRRIQFPPRHEQERKSSAPWFMVGLLMIIILLGIGLVRFRPDLILGTAANDAAKAAEQATPRPTLTADQQKAAAEAARLRTLANQEQSAIDQAIPTPDVGQPPPLPVQATAAAIQQPSALDEVPAGALSPIDLTYRPIPTPTTMLTQEQFDASQASEEQNFLNGQMQGLTPAQQMVKVHEAEGNAQP